MTTIPLQPEEVVQALMKGATPERADEINKLWRAYHPKVRVVEDRSGITLEASKDFIDFDPKTTEVFWLIGFSGWKAIECYSPHVIVSHATGTPLHTLFADDQALPQIEYAYKDRLAAALRLIVERDVAQVPWPPDIPSPTSDRAALHGDQDKVAFDLMVLATAFAFFHEFRHVMLDFDGRRSYDRKEEELQCDVWARDFMTAKLAGYASANGHDYRQVLRKRSMGLALAALILYEITPKNRPNPHYFSIKIRLSALLNDTRLPDNDHFWVFVASILIGVFRQQHIPIDPPPIPARALAEYLLDQLSH